MSFIETPTFPNAIAVGSIFGPSYSTGSARNLGGYVFSNRNWTYPLHEGDVLPGVKQQSDLNDLLAFFHAVAGMFNGFRFKDWQDYQAAGVQGTLINLSPTTWQMTKTYTYAAVSAVRKISKPVSGTAVISGGGTYSVDTTTGIITLTAGANPTGWTGQFDVPVKFAVDKILPKSLSWDVFDFQTVPIREFRV